MDFHPWLVDKFLYPHKHYSYGNRCSYFDHPNIIGWTRLGDKDHLREMAVLLSNGPGGSKWMEVDRPNAVFRDLTQHIGDLVRANSDRWGEFCCNGGSVSVWLEQ